MSQLIKVHPLVMATGSVALILVAMAFGMTDVWFALHENWAGRYGPYEHGYLVLVMAIWIGIVEWRRRAAPMLTPSWVALLPLAGCVGTLTLMELLYIDSTRLILIPPILLCSVWAALGWPVASRLVWSILFLYFALPQWWVINAPLQNLTVWAVSALLRSTSVPAYIEGNSVFLSAGAFEIASGCSGLNYLMAGLALAAFFGMVRLRSWRRRIAMLAMAGAVAIVFNWIRVFSIILIGHLSDMQHYLIRVEHHTYGWVLFLCALGPVVLFGMRLEKQEQEVDEPEEDTSPAIAKGTWRDLRGMVLVAVLVSALMLAPALPSLSAHAGGGASIVPLPPTVPGYSRAEAVVTTWTPAFAGADEELTDYRSANERISVFRAGYPVQSREHRVVSGANSPVGTDFSSEVTASRVVNLGSRSIRVLETIGRDASGRRLIWSWFEIGGRTAHSRFGAVAVDLLARVDGRLDAAFFAVSASCSDTCDGARESIQKFVVAAHPYLSPAFAASADSSSRGAL